MNAVFFRKIIEYKQAVLLLFSVFVFVCTVAYGFPDSPSPWLDEGINLGITKTWIETGIFSLQIAPGEFVAERPWLITNNYPVLAPIALSFLVFDVGFWQARIVMIGFVLAFLVATYFFVKHYYSSFAAALSVAFLVTFLPLYGNGMTGGLGELPGVMYLIVGLLFFESKVWWKVFLAGIFIGLAVATKPLFLPLLFALAGAEGVVAWRHKQVDWKRLGLLVGGMVVPLLVWLRSLFPGSLSFQYLAEIFLHYSNSQLTGNATVRENIVRLLTESTPLHFIFFILLFWIARVWSRKEHPLSRPEIILWIFVGIIIVYFLKSPGWYRYFFSAHLIVLVFSGVAVTTLLERFEILRWRTSTIYAGAFILLAVQTAHLLTHRGDMLYYNTVPREFAALVNAADIPNTETLMVIDQEEIVFLLGHPNIYHNFRINAALRVGHDLLASQPYPGFIIVGHRADSEYLTEEYQRMLDTAYAPVAEHGRYQLLKKNNAH